MWDHSCVRDYVEIVEIGSVPTSLLQEAIILETWKDLHEQGRSRVKQCTYFSVLWRIRS